MHFFSLSHRQMVIIFASAKNHKKRSFFIRFTSYRLIKQVSTFSFQPNCPSLFLFVNLHPLCTSVWPPFGSANCILVCERFVSKFKVTYRKSQNAHRRKACVFGGGQLFLFVLRRRFAMIYVCEQVLVAAVKCLFCFVRWLVLCTWTDFVAFLGRILEHST
jgi:hypothetical protein